MSQAPVQCRRATVEDIPALCALWSAASLPAAVLEKHFGEFQVAEANAQILAAIGFRQAGQHAAVHSEACQPGANADELRAHLWQRVLTVARNHGLARLWTQEKSPFWAQQKFVPAGAEVLPRLPAALGDPAGGWLTLQLKEETAQPSLEQEFALFRQAAHDENEALLQRAKAFKIIALLFAFVVFALVVAGAVFYFANRHKLAR